jgi:hypothetical protein
MISVWKWFATLMATSVLPTAVGPAMTIQVFVMKKRRD